MKTCVLSIMLKYSGTFGRKSNGIFGTTSGTGPLWSVGPVGAKSPFHFNKPVHCPSSLQKISLTWWIGERNRKWQESFLLVGPVWSENIIPFSSVSPAGLWLVGLTWWWWKSRNEARGVDECVILDLSLFVCLLVCFIQHFPRVIRTVVYLKL